MGRLLLHELQYTILKLLSRAALSLFAPVWWINNGISARRIFWILDFSRKSGIMRFVGFQFRFPDYTVSRFFGEIPLPLYRADATSFNLRCQNVHRLAIFFPRPTGTAEDRFSKSDRSVKGIWLASPLFSGRPFWNPRFLEMVPWRINKGFSLSNF